MSEVMPGGTHGDFESGPVAVVTGGLGALGSAIGRYLSESGYRVAIADVAGPSHESPAQFRVDVTNEGSCQDLAASVLEHYGAPTAVVVNCAGVMLRGSLTDLDLAAASKVHEVNVWGAHRVARAFLAQMRSIRFGRIINISSVQSWKGLDGYSAYASSKAALDSLTRVWARELGGEGITVNSVAPGYVDAPMIQGLFQRLGARAGCSPEQAKQDLMSGVAIGRLIRPSEVAGVVAFLAGEASSGVNGAIIPVDGGYALM